MNQGVVIIRIQKDYLGIFIGNGLVIFQVSDGNVQNKGSCGGEVEMCILFLGCNSSRILSNWVQEQMEREMLGMFVILGLYVCMDDDIVYCDREKWRKMGYRIGKDQSSVSDLFSLSFL